MATTVVKSIGATGRDYPTIQAFFDAVPDLVAADQIWEGQIYPDSGNTITGNFTVSKTTDGQRFIRLRPVAGSSFRDHANVRTNALRPNAPNGILLTTGNTSAIITHSCNIELFGLQLENTTASYMTWGNSGRITFDSCLVRNGSGQAAAAGVASSYGFSTRNSAFINGYLYTEGTVQCYLVSSSFVGANIHNSYNPAVSITNCAFFGLATPLSAGSDPASGNNNATSASSLPTTSPLLNQVSANQFEVFATDGTADLRLKAGNTIGAAGIYNASVLTDISGATRNTSTPSVGAWEYIASGDTTAPTLTSPTGTSAGTTTASGTVSTDEANGTLYWLCNTSATATLAAVKAGSSQAVSATGSQSVSVTGLTASTAYYLHYAHTDAAANDSTVANSASFTTSSAGVTATGTLASISLTAPTATATGAASATGSVSSIALVAPTASASSSGAGNATGSLTSIQLAPPTATAVGAASATGSLRAITLTAPTATAIGSVSGSGTITLLLTNNTGTLLSGETGATVHVYATSGAFVVTKTGQTTNGSGVMTITDALIVAATQYRVVVVLASGDEGLDKATAA